MSMSHGMGTTVTFNSSGISNINDLQVFSASGDAVDMTVLASTNNGMESLPGLVDYGSCEFTTLFDNASTVNTWITAAPATLVVTYPYNSGQSSTQPSFSITAECVEDEITIETDQPSTRKFSFKLSGNPTIGVGS